jgi:hypothetical protein
MTGREQSLGDGTGFIDGLAGLAGGDGDAVPGEELLGLVFVDVHREGL